MVVDSSALLAVLFVEPEREWFVSQLDQPGPKLMSAANHLECAMVAEARKGPAGGRELDLLIHQLQLDIVPFTSEQAEEARRVWRIFGKGNHLAGLNLCDCCALALSRISGWPLLYKGDDFAAAGVPRSIS